MRVFDHIRKRLLTSAGLVEVPQPIPGATIDDLRRSEWSEEFEKLMRNRLVMGAMRYGRLGAPGKPQYNRVTSIIKRLSLYQATGNTEMLVDAANLCLCEFVEGNHPNRHFSADDMAEKVTRK